MSRAGRGKGREIVGLTKKTSWSPIFHDEQLKPAELHPSLVKQARQSGVLNLTNRGYISVPDQVWNINSLTEKEVKTLSVSMDNVEDRWWDQVDLTRLNLANNLITEISTSISNLSFLQMLDLHDNKLTDLPESLGTLKFLSKLDLSHNQLEKIPLCVYKLTDLRVLLIKNNAIETMEEDVGNLSLLEELNVCNNKLKMIPAGIGFLSKVTQFDLSHNRIVEIPPEIGSMSALRILDLTDNCVSCLPNDAGDLHRLELLFLRHNQLTKLPILLNCNSLKELYCGGNCLTELPIECLEPLLNLKVFELRDNKIATIPDDIILLQFLERLDLTNNCLTNLPPSLGIMPHLGTLSIEGNSLKAIRRDIVQRGSTFLLKHLRSRMEEDKPDNKSVRRSPHRSSSNTGNGVRTSQTDIVVDSFSVRQSRTLDLCNKQLLEVPANLIQIAGEQDVSNVNLSKNLLTEVPFSLEKTFDHLLELNLSFNSLTSIPGFLGNAHRLTFLDLRSNQISELPTQLSCLKNMREVCLAINKFSEVPSALYALPKLEILIASDNKIQKIDVEGLSKLTALAVLDLRNNDIAAVPPELGNLRHLRSLNLEGNMFRQPRLAVLNRGTEELLQYLRDRIPT